MLVGVGVYVSQVEGVAYPVKAGDFACYKRGLKSCNMAYNIVELALYSKPACQGWCWETDQCVPQYAGPSICPLGDDTTLLEPAKCDDLDPAECVTSECRGLCVLPRTNEAGETESDWANARCLSRSEPCRDPETGAKVTPLKAIHKVPCEYRTSCFGCLHYAWSASYSAKPDWDLGRAKVYTASPNPDNGDYVCAWNTQTNSCENRDLSIPDQAGPSAQHLNVRMHNCPQEAPHGPFPEQ